MDNILDISFNIATMTAARRLFPTGYDVADDAPQTLEDATAHYKRTGRILVWSGASDRSIFGCPEHNWAFRAWHDWHHIKWQMPFTPDGEALVAAEQYSDLVDIYGIRDERLSHWAAIIDAEVNGQIAYSLNHGGEFPTDQLAFARYYLKHGPALATSRFVRF